MTNIRKPFTIVAAVLFLGSTTAQAQDVSPFEENGKLGFRNASGKIVIKPRYDRILSSREGVFIVRKDNKYCEVDDAGREFLPCVYDSLNRRAGDPTRFYVTQNGKGRFVDRGGREVTVSTPPPRPAPAAPTRIATPSSAPLPRFNLAKIYADQEKWPDAVAQALKGSNEDKRYVLLALSRAGNRPAATDPAASDSYRRYSAGADAVRNNLGIFDGAMVGATPGQRQQLSAMRRQFAPSVDPGPGSNGQGYIDARTAGECRSRGGTVSVMGYCRR